MKQNPQNNARSGNPPATPQIELPTLPRAVRIVPTCTSAYPRRGGHQDIGFAKFLPASEPAVRPTTRRGPRLPGEAASAATHGINAHNLDDAVEEARVDAPERTARLPREPTTEERERHEACGHAPFRFWRRACVMGRGARRPQANVGAESARDMPIVSGDRDERA